MKKKERKDKQEKQQKQEKQEILAQLRGVFIPEEKRESRLTTELLRIDNHNVARVTEIKDYPPEEQIYERYPDSISIKEMTMVLSGNSESSVKEAGTRLRKMFLDSLEDIDRIREIATVCRDFETKYYSTADDIKKQLVLYCLISELDKM